MTCPPPFPAGPGPLLSIVVLVYNTAPYLRECFDSLLGQQYRNIEVIAIDDASTDDSLAICREYEAAHPNFRCVSKANEGGAVSGNLGVSLARGEYVALVDSDDVVTPSGYGLLMAEALEADADIVVGRAARLSATGISAVAFLYEPFVWSRRRRLDSAAEFPEIHQDGFYWNKVFRTAFLRQNGLGMVPGLLYADRPFVHAAYWRSRRTCIIPDLVYLWRSRDAAAPASITQLARQADNFHDRMRSARIDWEQFVGIPEARAFRDAIAVENLQRALHTVFGIVTSPSFRRTFVPALQELLALYGDLNWRALGPRRSLYLELIRRGEVEALCFLLGVNADRGWIAELDGACYWKQPFLDNPEIPVPRELLRLDFPVIGFFQLHELCLEDSRLVLTLYLHEAIRSRCDITFELHAIEGEGGRPLEALGPVGRHRWRYALDLADGQWQPGSLHGLVMNYRTPDGAAGQYRIGQNMVPAQWQPQANAHGRLLHSPEAGGMGFAAN